MLQYKTSTFEIKSDASSDGSTFLGNAACFLNVDLGDDMLSPRCYDGNLAEFVANGVVRNEHNVTTGKITSASVSNQSLVVEGKISSTSAGNDQKLLLKDGVYKFLSIGHFVQGRLWLESQEDVQAIWDEYGYKPSVAEAAKSVSRLPIRYITKARPVEASTTFSPMNEKASIISVKADGNGQQSMTFDDHWQSVLDPVVDFVARVNSYLAIKGTDKPKPIPPNRLSQVRQLHDQLGTIIKSIESKAVGKADRHALEVEYIKTLSLLNSLGL